MYFQVTSTSSYSGSHGDGVNGDVLCPNSDNIIPTLIMHRVQFTFKFGIISCVTEY